MGCVPYSGRLGGGGVCPGGVSAKRGVCLSGWCLSRVVIHLPLPCGQTDACENITFLQLLLRTVIKCYEKFHKVAFQRERGTSRHESDVLAALLSVSAKSLNEMGRV